MEEKEFYVDFPSFKNHQYMYFAWNGKDGNDSMYGVPAIHQRDISQKTRDIQKIKEAIEDNLHSPMLGYSTKLIFEIISKLDIPSFQKTKIKSELTGFDHDVNLAKYYDKIKKELRI